jgi:prophage regulatory protein
MKKVNTVTPIRPDQETIEILAAEAMYREPYRPQSYDRFIKLKEVLNRVGISSTSVYNYIQQGTFPKQIKMGQTSFWSEQSVNAWMNAKKAEAES